MPPDAPIRWTAYPALLAACCLAAGIAASDLLSLEGWMAAGALAGTAGGLTRRRPTLVSLTALRRTIAAGLAVTCLGGALHAGARRLPLDHLAFAAAHAAGDVTAAGRVAADPERRPDRLRFPLDVRRIVTAGGDTLAVRGRLLASAYPPDLHRAPLRYGDEVVLRGRLRPAPRRRNPAEFDYGAYLARRGVYAVLTLDAPVAIERTGCRGPGCAIAALREGVRRRLERHVADDRSRAVLEALLLGDRRGLDADVRDRFVRTGLMHLLAVSGLHVLLVGLVLHALMRPWLLRIGLGWRAMEGARTGLTLVLLVVYAGVTGAPASVVRAVVMAAIWMGGTLLQRSTATLNTLGTAACLLLLAGPAQLYDAGFQLSFAAVAGIVTLKPVLEDATPEAWRRTAAGRHLIDGLTVSLAATTGALPVLLHHFGRAPLGGLLVNPVAIPLTFLALTAALLLVATGPSSFLGETFGAAADLFARVLCETAEAGDRLLGWAALTGFLEPGWTLGALVTTLAAVVHARRPRHRARLAGAALVCLNAGVWLPIVRGDAGPRLDVVFLDVGQGDAALVTLPGGRRLLVDAGPADPYVDAGERTVVPHLERFGIRRLDALLVTHPHADHLGGAPAILRAVPVGAVLHNGRPHPSRLYEDVNHLVDSLAVPARALRAGDTLALDPSVRIQVLGPCPEAGDDPNDASVVIRLAYGRTVFFFSGDVQEEGEEHLVRHYGELLAGDVVKVPHHGSPTSSTPALVELARPTIAVVSVAERNPFRHPSADVLRRWERQGAHVATTAGDGAVWLRSDGRSVEDVPWR